MREIAICISVVACVAAPGAQKPATEWLSSPAEAARIARIEAALPAVDIPNDAPVKMSLAQWMALYKIPGLSVAVFEHNAIIWAKTYGVKQAGTQDPVTLGTLFQAGSISKPVTAMAVLRYVEAGKWSLDANINDKLTSWKLPDNELTKTQKATLRRLLSHSAGTTVHGFPGYAVDGPRPTVVQVLDGEKPANTAPVRVDLVPGTQTRYSGGGTTIVQLMMVDQLKKPFPQIMREAVLDPLGLKNSTYEQPLPPAHAAQTATGTRAYGGSVEGRWHVYPEMAAAGLWTTASDLAQIAIEVSRAKAGKSARVLSQAMTKEMLTKQSEGFGIGFAIDPESDRFGHGGADEGFQAYLTAFADSGSGLVIMANSDNGSAIFNRVAASVAAEYGWKGKLPGGPDTARTKLDLVARTKGTAAALAAYRGSLRNAPDARSSPADLNGFGYQLLRENRLEEAVKVFEANVELYPQDANAYDSLGEAYLQAGRNEEAIDKYLKSLELDPKNPNAVKVLEKLGVRVP